jgi:excisionase family DNA binding protein
MKKDNSLIYPSVRALADELGISLALAYRHLADGSIPAVRLGNRYIISKSAIQRRLAEAGGGAPDRVA